MHSPASGKSQQFISAQAAQINLRWQLSKTGRNSLAPAKPLNPPDTHPDVRPEPKLRQELGCIFPSQEALPQLSPVPQQQQLPLPGAGRTLLPFPWLCFPGMPGRCPHSPCWQKAAWGWRSSPSSSRQRAGMVAAGPGSAGRAGHGALPQE